MKPKQPLDLTNRQTVFDYLLRHLAEKAKSMPLDEFVAFFVDGLLFKNRETGKEVLSLFGNKPDLIVVCNKLKEAKI